MPYDPDRQCRRSTGLPGYDWSQAEAYFVTVCVQRRARLLGEVADNEIRLTNIGQAVAKTWDALPACMPAVELDAFGVMPDHVHGIVIVRGGAGGDPGAAGSAPALKAAMRAFKSLSTLACNDLLGRAGGRFWQRGYDEYTLRDEHDLIQARRFIAGGPAHWAGDEGNPSHHTAHM